MQGALAKPKKKDGHKHGNYLIGTHRVAETTNPNCTRLYLRKADAYTRTTPLSQKEINIRAKFTAIAQAVAARRVDLSKISTDQANFLAQKDASNGKKTMRAYLWSLCKAEYEAQNS